MLDSLADNPMGWAAAMAPVIMGNPDRPELGEELANSFCRTDPEIAKEFARVTFTSDNRADLPRVTDPFADPAMPEDVSRRKRWDIMCTDISATATCDPECYGPLSQSERAGRSHCGDPSLCLIRNSHPIASEDLEDLYEHAPCGYLSLRPDGASSNRTPPSPVGSASRRRSCLGKNCTTC